jgi:beta-galactosidase
VPYAAGELTAVGYRAGAKVAEHCLVTCGPAQSLRLTADRNPIGADPNDLAYVTVEAIDAEGRTVPTADHVVRFGVNGPGHLAALGSNNPRHTEAYRGDRHRLFRGRCLAIVRPGEQAGEITLRAEAEGLSPAELTIETQGRE